MYKGDTRFVGITPACAGKSRLFKLVVAGSRDHPRLRGEKQKSWTPSQPRIGSPPLARGKDEAESRRLARFGITPACAGKSSIVAITAAPLKDHPRLRGEKKPSVTSSTKQSGSPPLARGKDKRSWFSPAPIGITPACAGKSFRNLAEIVEN